MISKIYCLGPKLHLFVPYIHPVYASCNIHVQKLKRIHKPRTFDQFHGRFIFIFLTYNIGRCRSTGGRQGTVKKMFTPPNAAGYATPLLRYTMYLMLPLFSRCHGLVNNTFRNLQQSTRHHINLAADVDVDAMCRLRSRRFLKGCFLVIIAFARDVRATRGRRSLNALACNFVFRESG